MLRDLFSLFPAYAGVILCLYIIRAKVKPFPRICGGDPFPLLFPQRGHFLFPAYAGVIPFALLDPLISAGFSPHMRG